MFDLVVAQIKFNPPPSSTPSAGLGVMGLICPILMGLLYLAVLAAVIAGGWKVFEKAGKPGWAAIVPFYNTFVLVEIVEKPILWFILMFVPCVNIVVAVMLALELAKAFGKDVGYGLGLAFLSPIFVPMLGFGSAQYQYGRRKKVQARDYDDEDEEPRPRRRPARDDD